MEKGGSALRGLAASRDGPGHVITKEFAFVLAHRYIDQTVKLFGQQGSPA
jgi:hypothetical protein